MSCSISGSHVVARHEDADAVAARRALRRSAAAASTAGSQTVSAPELVAHAVGGVEHDGHVAAARGRASAPNAWCAARHGEGQRRAAASAAVRSSQSRRFSSRMRLEERFWASFRKRSVLNGIRTMRRRCIRCRTSGMTRRRGRPRGTEGLRNVQHGGLLRTAVCRSSR